jgi:threonine dehydrogenase-like Zn-dependent dehydrogenase
MANGYLAPDLTFNVSDMDDKQLVEAIRGETRGGGADVGVETVGQPLWCASVWEMLRRAAPMETGNFADTGEVSTEHNRILRLRTC